MNIARSIRKLSNYPYALRLPLLYKARSWLRGFTRQHYYICVAQAAAEAHGLGFDRMAAIEFGVAGGNGLLELEAICDYIESKPLGKGILELESANAHIPSSARMNFDVYGFDNGEGLPKPTDYRDTPYRWDAGWYKMDVEGLKKKLRRSKLVIGNVAETVPAFIERDLSCPIGAVMFDLDYYSSTRDALAIFSQTPPELRLPRVFCYFDDISGIEDVGAMRAIIEFNDAHANMKIRVRPYWQYNPNPYIIGWKLFEFHQFDHPLYNKLVRSENVLG
jgi:hypothetical protein